MSTRPCPVCGQEVEIVAGHLAAHYTRHFGFAETWCEGSRRPAYPPPVGEMADDLKRDTYGVPYDDELREADEMLEQRLFGQPMFRVEEERDGG